MELQSYTAVIDDGELDADTPVWGCGCDPDETLTVGGVEPIGSCMLTPGDPSPVGRCPDCDGLVYADVRFDVAAHETFGGELLVELHPGVRKEEVDGIRYMMSKRWAWPHYAVTSRLHEPDEDDSDPS